MQAGLLVLTPNFSSSPTFSLELYDHSAASPMHSISVKSIFGSRQPLLCDVCQKISFDRLIEERTAKHRIFKELSSPSSHCILCKLIFQTMKRLIIGCSIPEIEVGSYLDKLGPSKLSLRFPLSEGGNDRLYIDVGPPSIMIDGWLPFGGSQNTLRLFRQHGKLHNFCSNALHRCLKSRYLYSCTCPSITRLEIISDSFPY